MYYSAIVLLAILILLIENYDFIFRRSSSIKQPAWKIYRKFLLGALVYYVSDALWGIIEYLKLPKLLYADTAFYFIAMAGCILLWTQFQVTYLKVNNRHSKWLVYAGRGFFGAFAAAVFVNLFTPVLFSVDAQCMYHTYPLRHIFLIVQIVLLILNSAYLLLKMKRASSHVQRRFKTIAFCSLIAAAFLIIQIWFPYLPLYTVAYLLGTCLLHTFVINDEREEYKIELEEAFAREKSQFEELKNARTLAYRDALTGVKSKLAYVEFEEKKNHDISAGRKPEFAVAVFDVNGLKQINDTLGHEKGDQFIIDACMTICKHFKRSPVFRIGGDEFVALIEGEDFLNREELILSFDRMMDHPKHPEQAIIAMGVSDYRDGEDDSFHKVFVRADHKMYERKHQLKHKAQSKFPISQ